MFYNDDINIIKALLDTYEGVSLEELDGNVYELTVPRSVLHEMYKIMNEELEECDQEQYEQIEDFMKDLCEDLVPELLEYEESRLRLDANCYYLGMTELSTCSYGYVFKFKIHEIDPEKLDDSVQTTSQDNVENASRFAATFDSMTVCMKYYRVLEKGKINIQMFKWDDRYGIIIEGDADCVVVARKRATEFNATPLTANLQFLQEHNMIIADQRTLDMVQNEI